MVGFYTENLEYFALGDLKVDFCKLLDILLNRPGNLRDSFRNMSQRRKDCPLCGKQNLVKLPNHLASVHQLPREKRQPYLTQAGFKALELDGQNVVARIIFQITIKSAGE